MLFVAITRWKEKCRFIFQLILFLLFLGFLLPKFLNYLAAEIAEYKSPKERALPPALRVEKTETGTKDERTLERLFTEKLRIFYREKQTEHNKNR
ncbi:MAG: hypothetical protein ACPLTR_01220 [Thermacetogeniaceae bacterium]